MATVVLIVGILLILPSAIAALARKPQGAATRFSWIGWLLLGSHLFVAGLVGGEWVLLGLALYFSWVDYRAMQSVETDISDESSPVQ